MKFSIGDEILLKQTGEEGHVTAYINDQMVEVEVHGTQFPVYIDDIDHPYLKWFTEQKTVKRKASPPEQIPVEKEKFRKPRLSRGIYLSFLPVFKVEEMEEVVDFLKIYLINELPYDVQFSYDVRISNESEFRHEGKIHAFGHLYLHNISFHDMNEQPRFHWKLYNIDDPGNIESGIVRIKPVKLFTHVNNVLQNNEPTFSYLLIEDFKKAPVDKKTSIKNKAPLSPSNTNLPPQPAPTTEAPLYKIDLHIEQLIENTKGLTNAEIMQIQLDTAKKYIQLAIANHQEKLIIVHGVGTGVLRDAVHQLLVTIPEVDRYMNEWNGRYGFGATEVDFKY